MLGPLFYIIHINDLPLELHSDVTSTMFVALFVLDHECSTMSVTP